MAEQLVEEAYTRSLDILRGSAHAFGFAASDDGDAHYGGLWVRDAGLAAMAALALGEPELLDSVRGMLRTICDNMTELGQVPNTVWPSRNYRDFGEVGSLDAPSWFLKVACAYTEQYGDTAFAKEIWPFCRRAYSWLQHQDTAGFGLVTSPPAADWMDSSFHRHGMILHNNVLFYDATVAIQGLAAKCGAEAPGNPDLVRQHLHQLFWPDASQPLGELLRRSDADPVHEWPHPAMKAAYAAASDPDRNYFISHVSYGSFADVCDTLGNLLAIHSGIASPEESGRILTYLRDAGADQPFMMRTYTTAQTPENDRWQMYSTDADKMQDPRWRNMPNSYHNAGCWPYIGGYYVMDLVQTGDMAGAEAALLKLAESNQYDDWGFLEWINSADPEDKRRGQRRQTWNAAAYILAYQALKKG